MRRKLYEFSRPRKLGFLMRRKPFGFLVATFVAVVIRLYFILAKDLYILMVLNVRLYDKEVMRCDYS